MLRKVLPLKGTKSLRALNACHALLLGYKMLPVHIGTSYEEFYASFQEKSDVEKENTIRQAALFVQLNNEELEALVCFCADKNGVPYTSVNLKSLALEELHEIIVAVCMEISRIKIDIVTEAEKKN